MKPIQCTIGDPTYITRIRAANKARRSPSPREARAVREMALERAKQIEDFGDVPMMPARFAVAGAIGDQQQHGG